MAVYDATRLKTGRGKHGIMLVSAGSPTKDGSASSATGQYLQAGSYCKVITDDSGGLKLANLTDNRTTPTSGDNGYIAETIIFNFSADTMTDKWANSLTNVRVITDMVPADQADPYGYDSSIGMNLEYFDPGAVTNDAYNLLIAAGAIEILEVQAILGTSSTVGTVQVSIGGVDVLSTALAPSAVLGTGVIYTTDSVLGSDGDMLVMTIAGTWTNSEDLTVRIDYRYI